MNTKQILYNALQVQLDAKKQAYNVYNETVTQPSFYELITDIRKFITSIAPIDDSNELELGNQSLRIRLENGYSGYIELHLNGTWKGDKYAPHLDLDWNSGGYNLVNKSDRLKYVNVLHSLANNLKPIEDSWLNDWKVKYNNIWEADSNIKKEYEELQSALNTLRHEIHSDLADSMKQIGFKIEMFKQAYDLDWDYDRDTNARTYKIVNTPHSIKLQYGRSQYDTCYVHGFKVLGKKGNKYNIEVNRNSHIYTYDVLEKKFDSFIDDVTNWENIQADKRKADTEKRFAERTK